MKRIIVVLLVVVFHFTGNGQESNNFNLLTVHPVSNLDWHKNNQKETEVFARLFKKYNVVVLGENLHYEGGIRDAECMLIKELIESGTINTVYIEASRIDLERINSILKNKGVQGIEETIRYCGSLILFYWVDNGFWEYLARKTIEGKIKLVGVDVATTSSYAAYQMFKEAYQLPTVKSMIKSAPEDLKALREEYHWFNNYDYDIIFSKIAYERQLSFINVVLGEYVKLNDKEKHGQWSTMRNYYQWKYKRQFSVNYTNKLSEFYKDEKQKSSFYSLRDSMMSEIFLDSYRSKKDIKAIMIVSAYHALNNFRNSSAIEECCVNKNNYVFNEMLNQELPGEIYSICFASSSGSYGVDNYGKKDVKKIKPHKKSIEYYFRNSPHDFFYADFSTSALKGSFPSNVMLGRTLCAEWAKIYQGFFFIKNMYPVRLVNEKKHEYTFDADDTVYQDILEEKNKGH